MVPVGRRSELPRVPWETLEPLPEGCLMARMRKFTLLDVALGGLGGMPAEGWVGEISRRQRLTGRGDPGGECRLLFGVGEGPTEAVARRQQCCKTPLSGAGAKGRLSIL